MTKHRLLHALSRYAEAFIALAGIIGWWTLAQCVFAWLCVWICKRVAAYVLAEYARETHKRRRTGRTATWD